MLCAALLLVFRMKTTTMALALACSCLLALAAATDTVETSYYDSHKHKHHDYGYDYYGPPKPCVLQAGAVEILGNKAVAEATQMSSGDVVTLK